MLKAGPVLEERVTRDEGLAHPHPTSSGRQERRIVPTWAAREAHSVVLKQRQGRGLRLREAELHPEQVWRFNNDTVWSNNDTVSSPVLTTSQCWLTFEFEISFRKPFTPTMDGSSIKILTHYCL